MNCRRAWLLLGLNARRFDQPQDGAKLNGENVLPSDFTQILPEARTLLVVKVVNRMIRAKSLTARAGSPDRASLAAMMMLLQIAVDNSHWLSRKSYLFEYEGTRFKMISSRAPQRPANMLLSLVPAGDERAEATVFARAGKFLSALAWENGGCVGLSIAGSASWPDDRPLSKAVPNLLPTTRISPLSALGFSMNQIANIKTESQRRALALYREAGFSNNDYLALLFYWQILEVEGRSAEKFVDYAIGKQRQQLRISDEYIQNLPRGRRSYGQYFWDDCRSAIAHITRSKGRRQIDFDVRALRVEFSYGVHVIRAIAHYYIRGPLNLNEHLYLVRPRSRGFPVYVDTAGLRKVGHRFAYRAPRLRLSRPRR
jgi:hypothetical protein